MADLEAHAQVLGAVIQEEDCEDAVVDDGPNQLGDPVHQGVEVERGVQGVGQLMQKIDLVGGSMRIFGRPREGEDSWRGGAIVAFEAVFGWGLSAEAGSGRDGW